jgi:metallo-beta-lactamase class B
MSQIVLAFLFALAVHEDAKPFPAYQIAGNLYYVGTNDITSYLVTTPAGHILINEGYEETPALIAASIEKLGFKVGDVKILLNGQAHYDHVEGMAAMQKLTGAEVWSSAAEVPVLESGGKADYRFGRDHQYPPVKVAHVIADGEKVTLGGVTLVAHVTGGHSVGCTTWTMQVEDGGKKLDVVIIGGTTINPGVTMLNNKGYPTVSDDFARTFKVLRSLKCDIYLGAHGGYYGMLAKYERMKRGEQPNPFIDPAGYIAHIDRAEKIYLDQLARERAAK